MRELRGRVSEVGAALRCGKWKWGEMGNWHAMIIDYWMVEHDTKAINQAPWPACEPLLALDPYACISWWCVCPCEKLFSFLAPRRTRKFFPFFLFSAPAARWTNEWKFLHSSPDGTINFSFFLINHSMDISVSHRVPHASPSVRLLAHSNRWTCWFLSLPLRLQS